jgi:hypothetical protein
MPLLTQPATLPESNEQEPAEETGEAEAEVEEEAPKKGKKGKGGVGKKAKGGKGKKEEVEPVEEEAGEVTLIDEIWPKKEALGLTKWFVHLSLLAPEYKLIVVMIVYRYIPLIPFHYSFSTLMDPLSQH